MIWINKASSFKKENNIIIHNKKIKLWTNNERDALSLVSSIYGLIQIFNFLIIFHSCHGAYWKLNITSNVFLCNYIISEVEFY